MLTFVKCSPLVFLKRGLSTVEFGVKTKMLSRIEAPLAKLRKGICAKHL